MIKKTTLDFLSAIKKNNNREWFEKNKDRYVSAKDDVADMIEAFLKEAVKFEKGFVGLNAKDCVYRIYRDVRFSKDKKPYKTNLGASVNIGGKKAMNAGYYIHVEPGGSFIAGGMWMPPADQLKMIRQEIDYNGKDIRVILKKKDFKSYYGELDQSYALKTSPKGYAKDHVDIDLLKLNSFIVIHKFSDAQVMKKDFPKQLAKGAKIMKPFLDFLNVAIHVSN